MRASIQNHLRFISRLRPYFNKKELIALTSSADRAEAEFKAALAELTGCRHVLLFSYGRSALYAFLRANCLQPTTVFSPAYNCTAVPYAILKAGHRLAWGDVSGRDANLDLSTCQPSASPQGDAARVLLITHMYGNTSPSAPAREWCRTNGAQYLIADAALALFSYDNKRHVAQCADGAILSFSTGKHLSSIEGGAFVTNDEQIFARMKSFVEANLRPPDSGAALRKLAFLMSIYLTYQGGLYPIADFLFHRTPLLNFLMSGVRSTVPELPSDAMSYLTPLQLRIAGAQVEKLAQIRDRRKALQTRYLQELGHYLLINSASADNALSHTTIRVRDRQAWLQAAHCAGLYLEGPLYEYSLCDLPQLQISSGDCFSAPVAARLAAEVVNLPLYPDLTENQQDRVLNFLRVQAQKELLIQP